MKEERKLTFAENQNGHEIIGTFYIWKLTGLCGTNKEKTCKTKIFKKKRDKYHLNDVHTKFNL